MSYTVCTIREVVEGPIPETAAIDDGLIHPVPLDRPDTVATEPRDGQSLKRVPCTGLKLVVHGEKRPLLEVSDIRAELVVTDARITIACSKYDKGGGWWGLGAGALFAIPANVGSKVLAARRRRGKMLVGQIRYPWLDSVYAQNKGGWTGVEKLRLFVNAGNGALLKLELSLPKDVDATAVGTEIIRRAAAYRLAHDEDPFEHAERARLEQLAQLPALQWQRDTGTMAGEEFPSSWPVSERSARFGLNGTSAGPPVGATPPLEPASAEIGMTVPVMAAAVEQGSRSCVIASCPERGVRTADRVCSGCGQPTQISV